VSGDPRIGTQLGPYRIESLIARGGMGVVYLAEHVHLGRKAAVKILVPELAQDEAFRERFIRESRMAAATDHRNIIPVYDAGEADGELYIAMRYVVGTDLKDLLAREGRLDTDRAAAVIGQVAAALDTAHARGLVHRDVKPGNILIEEAGGHVFLTDFGLVKRSRSVSALTRAGQFVGTISYMAPEQIQGQEVDGRADVYSLGCVLYECLVGEPPYQRDQEVAMMYAHLVDPPPSVSERRPDLPPGVDDVMARAMAKSPGDRFQTGAELVEALREAVAAPPAPTETVEAPPPVVVPPATPPAGTYPPGTYPPGTYPPGTYPPGTYPPGTYPPPPPRRRRTGLLVGSIVTGLVVFTALVVGILMVSGGDGDGEDGGDGGGGAAGCEGKFVSEKFPYCVALPQDWTKIPTPEAAGDAETFAAPLRVANLIVSTEVVPEGFTTEQYVENGLQGLRAQGLTPGPVEDTTLGGEQAKRWTLTGAAAGARQEQVGLVHEGTGWFLTFTAQEDVYDQQHPLFEEMMQSWVWT
jgi:serine/threonine protein kinase